MAYQPWPIDGCTLAEARERTADRLQWKKWLRSKRRKAQRGQSAGSDKLEEAINRECCSFLLNRQLVAYGTLSSDGENARPIAPSLWATLVPNWRTSSLHDPTENCVEITNVRVFPLVHAPNRVELLVNCSFKQAFKRCVLMDPEVSSLSRVAIAHVPDLENILIKGRWSAYGDAYWPLDRDGLENEIIPTPEWGLLLSSNRTPDAPAVTDAGYAMSDRMQTLLGLLRDRQLTARGIAAKDAGLELIPHTVWSHKDFRFDAQEGDILQINHDCEDPPTDMYLRRWHGLVLEKDPTSPKATKQPEIRAERKTPSETVSEKPAMALEECTHWLATTMATTPHARPSKKDDWWSAARDRWGTSLSRRAFNLAWMRAVTDTGATGWTRAGAPRKQPKKSLREGIPAPIES